MFGLEENINFQPQQPEPEIIFHSGPNNRNNFRQKETLPEVMRLSRDVSPPAQAYLTALLALALPSVPGPCTCHGGDARITDLDAARRWLREHDQRLAEVYYSTVVPRWQYHTNLTQHNRDIYVSTCLFAFFLFCFVLFFVFLAYRNQEDSADIVTQVKQEQELT